MIRPFAILLLTLSPLTVGAETLSATSTPQGGRSTDALRMAFEGQGLRSGASVLQSGKGNEAVLGQSGTGQKGIIVQRGSQHSAILGQTSNSNSYTVIQLGRGATNVVTQTGGETGATIQVGGRDR